ncbi:hypothetical protein QQY66_25860 [Streptomyces sp. DG2A-72]|uniref:hypothetical protein n=1 Tax=Streptomyces sp. DG2A-72 TaxID=3051386 RepID=UPI00265C0CB9|nr:hypothetical protein [Streptomyces sp. DG2A-72]MDO0934927.1 hypothetical protein [Streptomyces sp. DG2A-72]
MRGMVARVVAVAVAIAVAVARVGGCGAAIVVVCAVFVVSWPRPVAKTKAEDQEAA